MARAGDLAALLTNLEPKDVLFIDEIHMVVGAGATVVLACPWSNGGVLRVEGGTLELGGTTVTVEQQSDFPRRGLSELS